MNGDYDFLLYYCHQIHYRVILKAHEDLRFVAPEVEVLPNLFFFLCLSVCLSLSLFLSLSLWFSHPLSLSLSLALVGCALSFELPHLLHCVLLCPGCLGLMD